MLDISIPKVVKVITSAAAAAEFCNQYVRIVEKLDGTKLTFIRNSEPFDESNYLSNWIVAYKEGVVFPEEFTGLVGKGRDEEIRSKSAGRSQYAFVHEHLKRVHRNTSDFPTDYEFFIEFIQRKPTISRSYEKTGGLFLTGFGPTVFSLRGARITSLAEFENDYEKFEYFRQALDLESYPVLFEGRLDSVDNLVEGSSDSSIAIKFEDMRQKLDSLIQVGNWKEVLNLIVGVFSDFTSALGGDAEGVVISPLPDPNTGDSTKYTGKLFKTSRADQHDQEMRKIKKQQEYGEGTKEQESAYYENLSRFIRSKIDEDDLDDESLSSMLAKISEIVYEMSREDFANVGVENSRKELIVIQDDAIAAARNIAGKRSSAGVSGKGESVSIGVVPMAVKPLHKGHWAIIEQAARDNDKVFLIVSAKSRESGGVEISGSDMIKIWKRYLEPILPQNVDISYSGEPVGDTRGAIRAYANDPEVSFRLYAGEDDKARFDPASLEKYYPIQYASGRIEPVFVKNVELPGGGRISGTYMRELLANGDEGNFKSLLPDNLDDQSKDSIWKTLYRPQMISESSIRYFIRESLRFV
jgi:hypothetical protein